MTRPSEGCEAHTFDGLFALGWFDERGKFCSGGSSNAKMGLHPTCVECGAIIENKEPLHG